MLICSYCLLLLMFDPTSSFLLTLLSPFCLTSSFVLITISFPFYVLLFSSLLTGGFIIRIFSTAPIVVELVANLFHVSKTGDWKRTSEVPHISSSLVSTNIFLICILLNSIVFNIWIYPYLFPFLLPLVLVILYFLFF